MCTSGVWMGLVLFVVGSQKVAWELHVLTPPRFCSQGEPRAKHGWRYFGSRVWEKWSGAKP